RLIVFGVLLAGAIGLIVGLHRGSWDATQLANTVGLGLLLPTLLIWPLCLLAVPAGSTARAWWRARLRPKIEALTPTERAEVQLRRRRDESLDRCDMVEPLIRILQLKGNEVTPAGAAEGTGRELSTGRRAGGGDEATPAADPPQGGARGEGCTGD